MPTPTEAVAAALEGKSASEQQKILKEATASLPAEQKQALAEAIVLPTVGVTTPSQPTSDWVWKTVVWAFAIVMVGAALVLGISVFVRPVEGATNVQMILTVFTTATAFLAGLFAPSPVANKTGE